MPKHFYYSLYIWFILSNKALPGNYFYFINRKEWDFFKIKHFCLTPEFWEFFLLWNFMEGRKTGNQLSQELNYFLGLILHKFIAKSLN